MFELTKLLGALLMPLSLILLAGLLGLLLLFTRRWRWGRNLLMVTLAAFYLLAWEPFAARLLEPLEEQYAPLLEPREQLAEEAVDEIVVLGHGHRLDPRLPITAQANADGVTRVLEGVRLQRLFPEAGLTLTGGAVRGDTPNSAVIYRLLEALQVDVGPVARLDHPRNTAEEAAAVAERRAEQDEAGTLILVTEASHMPRAMALFRGQGLDPVPAPTGHRVRAHEPGAAHHPGHALRPSSHAVRMSERAFHEYLGILWARLRGWTG